jgi:acetyl coenzyme A synthetase (ADP forming)-like protein
MHSSVTVTDSAAQAPKPHFSTLESLFRPRSIAVIGASRDPAGIGGAVFKSLMKHGFNGPVYPVNPKSRVVQSVAAYPTIEAVPGEVDMAVIVVPATHVMEAVEACGRKGVKAVVIISAGFKEVGDAGAKLEQQLLDVVRAYGMRMVGPNCLGVINTEPDVSMDATFAPTTPQAGNVAFSSQSGALGVAIIEYATELGIGISHFASVGNKADVSGNDLLEFWEQDPGTSIILLYLESFGNPRRFIPIARRVGRRKPIIAVKSGRTRAGMRAASSHTGSIAGTDTAVDALCRQSGVIRTNTLEELFDVAMLLAHQPVPHGRRVGILTNAGGPGILASDALETHGLEVPILSDATVAALRTFLAPEASTRNPVDMIASATPASFEKAVGVMMDDPNLDALLVLYVPPIITQPLEMANAIVRGVLQGRTRAEREGRLQKPVLSCFLGTHGVPEAMRTLHADNIPSYLFPEAAAIALARAVRYGMWRDVEEGRVIAFAIDRDGADKVLERAVARGGDGWLRPDEVTAVLGAYGIRQPETIFARGEDEAVAAAVKVGYPVVLKLQSDTLTHKTDVGGVILDVRDDDEVRAAWRRIRAGLEALGQAGAMQGVVVQPLLREGVETILGLTRDPGFGPLLMFGLGGINVELLKDVAFRIAPLTDRDAREMVREVRGFPLLTGFRGAPKRDVAAVEDALLRLSALAENHPALMELDLNPVLTLAEGRGVVAIDARIRVGRPGV